MCMYSSARRRRGRARLLDCDHTQGEHGNDGYQGVRGVRPGPGLARTGVHKLSDHTVMEGSLGESGTHKALNTLFFLRARELVLEQAVPEGL